MAAAIIAIRKQAEEQSVDDDDKEAVNLLENIRSRVPEKEHRIEELVLGVLVLG